MKYQDFVIKNVTCNSFQIDIENNNFTFKNGVVNYVYQPQVFNHESFEIIIPSLGESITEATIGKWIKNETLEKIDIIQQYYGYNIQKAKQVESIFSDEHIQHLRRLLSKGGLKE